jgi:hypothetical protein
MYIYTREKDEKQIMEIKSENLKWKDNLGIQDVDNIKEKT